MTPFFNITNEYFFSLVARWHLAIAISSNSGLKLYKSSTKTQEYSGKGTQIEFDQVKVKEIPQC